MKNYRILLLSFILGLATLLCYKYYQRDTFLVVDKNWHNDIDYQSVMINNCAYSTDVAGEVWLGYDMVTAFKHHYDNVDMLFIDEHIPYHDYYGIQIYLRGYYKFKPPFPDKQHINISYIIYPLRFTRPNKNLIKKRDKIKLNNFGGMQLAYDELQFFDALAVGSIKYAEKLKKAGYNAYYVPQFTDEKKFHYEFLEEVKSEVLFVGNIRKKGAPVIALKHGLPITIYGPNWGGIAKKDFVKNDKLNKFYSSAKIVLNDHRDDMRDNGFINNRTFDVTACGTLLISDYMPEIEEIYGDSVPMWKTEEELVALIKYYLDPANEAERLEKAKRAQEITLNNFTAKHIAQKFEDIIKAVKTEKGLK